MQKKPGEERSYEQKTKTLTLGKGQRREKYMGKEINDHLPLWTEFKINELTQQLDQIINNP